MLVLREQEQRSLQWMRRMITGGFGILFDIETGTSRRWVLGRDGVKRWADNLEPCKDAEAVETQPTEQQTN